MILTRMIGSETMLYCPKCKMLFEDRKIGENCPVCSHALRMPQQGDFIYVLTLSKEKESRAQKLLSQAGIPFRSRTVNLSKQEFRLFVPYETLDRCYTVLGDLIPAPSTPKELTPMPEEKRKLCRFLSLILFFLLIWAVVAAADTVANFFVSFFQR